MFFFFFFFGAFSVFFGARHGMRYIDEATLAYPK